MASDMAERFMSTLQQIEQTGDPEPLVAMFTGDAELSNLAIAEPMRGLEGARHFWHEYLLSFGEIRSQFTHVVDGNNAAVMEWISEGVRPSGEPIRYRGVSIIETDGQQVRCFRAYYDSAVFMPQAASL